MSTTYIPIKGMVCRHCMEAVEAALAAAGIAGATVSLGGAEIPSAAADDADTMRRLDFQLAGRGFERLADAEAQLVERAKLVIIEHVREGDCRLNLSACLQSHLNCDYSVISRVFSAREGRTVEKYAIAQRVEYVKELLSYRQLTISEIADKAGYSSVAHLSRQFKSLTGLTPTDFMRAALPRIPINQV